MRDDDHYDRTCGPDFKQVLRKSVKEFTAEVGKASTEKLMDRLSTSDSWDAYAAECADFAGRIVRYRRRSGRSDIPLGDSGLRPCVYTEET